MFSFGLLYYLSDLSCTFSQSFEWKRVAYRCILSAKVVLEAAALLTSSSSSLLEVCVRSLLLWYKAVQLLRGSAALCGEEIGKKVTEEVETESRSRGRKASLVACSQHISLSLSLFLRYKFMQVLLFLPFVFGFGTSWIFLHSFWLYRKAVVPAPVLQSMLDSARQAKTVSSGFRQSLEELMQTALPLTPDMPPVALWVGILSAPMIFRGQFCWAALYPVPQAKCSQGAATLLLP